MTRRAVQSWLEHYEALQAGDRPMDYVPGNSGPRTRDGVSGGRVNRIMLDDALKKLPPLLLACVTYRWLRPIRRKEALERLGVSKDVYYRRCNWAIDYLYAEVNGLAVNRQALLEAIRQDKG